MGATASKFTMDMNIAFDDLIRKMDEVCKKSDETMQRSDETIRNAEKILNKSGVFINQYMAYKEIREEQKTMREGLRSAIDELLRMIKDFFKNREVQSCESNKFRFF